MEAPVSLWKRGEFSISDMLMGLMAATACGHKCPPRSSAFGVQGQGAVVPTSLRMAETSDCQHAGLCVVCSDQIAFMGMATKCDLEERTTWGGGGQQV